MVVMRAEYPGNTGIADRENTGGFLKNKEKYVAKSSLLQ
jgi:hypothetical protein